MKFGHTEVFEFDLVWVQKVKCYSDQFWTLQEHELEFHSDGRDESSDFGYFGTHVDVNAIAIAGLAWKYILSK